MTAHELALRLLDEHGLDRAHLPRLAEAIGGCLNWADGSSSP